MRTSALVTSLLVAALVAASCSANAPQAQSPGSSASASPTGDAATATARGALSPWESDATPTVGPTAVAPSADVLHLDPDATYAEVKTDRELTDVERALLREPGPYAGDAFDAQAVFYAAASTDPQTPQAWAEAILTQIQPNYVADAQRAISREVTARDVPDQPVQELRDVPVVGQSHFAIVLDAGGSMAEFSTGATRMDQVKGAVRDFVDRLPQGSTASLRIYGHEGGIQADRAESCSSTTVVYDGPSEGLSATLDSVQPGGWAPLAMAVREADADIPPNTSDAVVYVVTDGVDTCGGDPVTAADELADQRLQPVVNVIGLQVATSETPQLRDMAEAAGGDYVAVGSQAELEAYWRADLQAMLDAWRVWQVEAFARIEQGGSPDSERAQGPGQAIMSASDLEWEQAQQIVSLMGRQGRVDYSTRLSVFEGFHDRQIAIWGWGYDHVLARQPQVYEPQVSSWELAYDLGVDRWSRYYGKWAQGE